MQTYFERAHYLLSHAPAEGIRDYILHTDTGRTIIELIALKIMIQCERGERGAGKGQSGSIYAS